MKRIILICVLAVSALFALHAQDVVKGKVVDKHGNPVPGVKIETNDGKEFTLSGLDGTFSLSPGITYGDAYARYGGFKSVSSRIYQDMTIVMRPETWWNREPYKKDWFILLESAFRFSPGTSNTPSLGLMFGQVKRWGWYVKGTVWLKGKSDLEASQYVDFNDEKVPIHQWLTTGKVRRSTSALTAGAVARLGCALHLYFGAGMALLQDQYQLVDNRWIALSPSDYAVFGDVAPKEELTADRSSTFDLVWDIGLMLNMDILTLSVGASWLFATGIAGQSGPKDSACMLNIGIGVNF